MFDLSNYQHVFAICVLILLTVAIFKIKKITFIIEQLSDTKQSSVVPPSSGKIV